MPVIEPELAFFQVQITIDRVATYSGQVGDLNGVQVERKQAQHSAEFALRNMCAENVAILHEISAGYAYSNSLSLSWPSEKKIRTARGKSKVCRAFDGAAVSMRGDLRVARFGHAGDFFASKMPPTRPGAGCPVARN